MDRSDLLYDIASAQSKEQDESRRHFDTMATGILALSGALVGMLIFSKADWAYWSIIPAVIVLLGFFGVATTTLVSLWLRKWYFQPPLSDLYKHIESGKYEDEALVRWSGRQIMSAIEHNRRALSSKSLWLSWAYICLIVEIIASGIFVFIVST
jgi:hypothetical protein